MHFSPLILSLITFISKRTIYVSCERRIIGGSNISIDKCPYQLSLQKKGVHICGATVISKSWAVTAAACVKGISTQDLSLRAGSSSYKSGGTVHEVKNIVIHSSFNAKTKDYDIALIEVKKTFDTKSASPIGLWSTGAIPSPGTSSLALGWGVRTLGGTVLAESLQQVSLPLVEARVCGATDDRITIRQLCAGYATGGKDICDGDYGGPLIAAGKLLGVATWSSCGRTGGFGVYTSVPEMRAWIKKSSGV